MSKIVSKPFVLLHHKPRRRRPEDDDEWEEEGPGGTYPSSPQTVTMIRVLKSVLLPSFLDGSIDRKTSISSTRTTCLLAPSSCPPFFSPRQGADERREKDAKDEEDGKERSQKTKKMAKDEEAGKERSQKTRTWQKMKSVELVAKD
ncbi:unnamed protein product [Calypogeia fissa]